MDKQTDNHLPVIQIVKKAAASDFYAEQLADLVERRGLMEAPANMKSSILARSSQLDVRLLAGSNRLNKKLSLWYYELKVSLAAACCVGVILSAPGIHEKYMLSQTSSRNELIGAEAFEIIQELNQRVEDFSRHFLEMEAEPYDEQEK